MPTPPTISTPAGYAPAFALGYSDAQSQLQLVGASTPLPVTIGYAAPMPTALTGQAAASQVAGPYNAASSVPIVVSLGGTWTGTVQLLRSIDGGATRLPVLIGGSIWGTFHEQGAEQVWIESEQGVSFYLDITLASGTLTYRVSQ